MKTVLALCVVWILWAEQSSLINPIWSVVDSMETRRQCQDQLENQISYLIKEKSWKQLSTNQVEKNLSEDGKVKISYRYVCLPDTIDPRKPFDKP